MTTHWYLENTNASNKLAAVTNKHNCTAIVDPAPDLPNLIFLETPRRLNIACYIDHSESMIERAETVFISESRQTRFNTDLLAFLVRLSNAITYQRNSHLKIDALLLDELRIDIDEHSITGYQHKDLLERSIFRHELAHWIHLHISNLGIYRKGYLFYSISAITPSAIVLQKTSY